MINFIIKLLSKFVKPINGDSNIWLERNYPLGGQIWREFLCGSCKGIYRVRNKEFEILAVINTKKNNDFNKVLEWFEKSCKREEFALSFLEIGNPKLRIKLEKLGFIGDEKKMIKNY